MYSEPRSCLGRPEKACAWSRDAWPSTAVFSNLCSPRRSMRGSYSFFLRTAQRTTARTGGVPPAMARSTTAVGPVVRRSAGWRRLPVLWQQERAAPPPKLGFSTVAQPNGKLHRYLTCPFPGWQCPGESGGTPRRVGRPQLASSAVDTEGCSLRPLKRELGQETYRMARTMRYDTALSR